MQRQSRRPVRSSTCRCELSCPPGESHGLAENAMETGAKLKKILRAVHDPKYRAQLGREAEDRMRKALTSTEFRGSSDKLAMD